ncbi:nucleoside recognition domain-containing protein [Rubrobacter aplysinae]|uniref:nucleoside recognition domain-containing protein n=1 Tax=Rubrobacter aplysinae TaxID=909625 RepID=UPI000B0925B6|nr:nucleoside recognition domain-containing protein [Rubrobacter aplysinae]
MNRAAARLAKTLARVRWLEGLLSGLRTAWKLGRIIFPVTLAVSLLRYTPVYEFLLSGLSPVMGVFGLPQEAAVALLLGNLLNLYAAIGAILTMGLTVKQVFILAVMLSFSHGLPVESAVCRQVGASLAAVLSFRIGLAVVSGITINLVWSGGGAQAGYGLASGGGPEPSGPLEITTGALQSAAVGVIQISAIVIPLMVFIQVLKDLGALERFAARTRPLVTPLGIPAHGSITMAGGLLFGLAFGAGVILEQAREQGFTRREITLVLLFLCACHAVVEDTLIFIPLGIPVLPLLLIRLTVAVALTAVIATVWRRPVTVPD